ncbi:MAG: branched-chain amino acid ABC transporter permease [Methanoregulaceae archaeon]|nr:branched-chain amino acid ABC transporter permease [Methanoregulaceae archaeon]
MKFFAVRAGSIALAVAACFALQSFAVGKGDLFFRLVFLAGLYVTLAVSLNLINGITGQFSIGHAAFYMVGAYGAGYMANNYAGSWGLKGPLLMLVLLLIGAVVAAVAGLVVGLPSLRLRGDYLAVVTLGFGEIIRIFVQNSPPLGGAYGLTVDAQFKFKYVWMVWLLAILCIAVCRNLLKSAHGLPFLAVREDEIASSAMGVNVTRVKVTAFVIGSAFAGAAGAMLANFDGFISPTSFPMELSFTILTMVVLGGTGSITGSALAGGVLFYIPEYLRDLKPVSGSSLVAAVIAVIAAVYVVKRIADHYHGDKGKRAALYLGTIIAGVALQMILAAVFKNVPSLANANFEASKLRMVIFSSTLIILMLLRPQGVFAHHEFSWSWVQRLFGKKVPTTAVSV